MSVETVGTVAWAADLTERHLAVLGGRWRHTQAVARRAAEAVPAVGEQDRDLLVTAAWLHDLGYGPEVRQTGFIRSTVCVTW